MTNRLMISGTLLTIVSIFACVFVGVRCGMRQDWTSIVHLGMLATIQVVRNARERAILTKVLNMEYWRKSNSL